MNWTEHNVKFKFITAEQCLQGCSQEQLAFYHLQIIQSNFNSHRSRQIFDQLETAVCEQRLLDAFFDKYETSFSDSLGYVVSYVYNYCQLHRKHKKIQSALPFDQFVEAVKQDDPHCDRLKRYSEFVMNATRNKSLRNNLTLLYKPRPITLPYNTTSQTLAEQFYRTKDIKLCPVLADSLMDEGYDDELILETLTKQPEYISRGSWIIQKLK